MTHTPSFRSQNNAPGGADTHCPGEEAEQARPTLLVGRGLKSRTRLAMRRVEAVSQLTEEARVGPWGWPASSSLERCDESRGPLGPPVLTPQDPVTRIILTHSAHISQVGMSPWGGTTEPPGVTRQSWSPGGPASPALSSTHWISRCVTRTNSSVALTGDKPSLFFSKMEAYGHKCSRCHAPCKLL